MSVLFSAYGKKIESTLTIENKSSQKIDNSTSLSTLDWEVNYEGIITLKQENTYALTDEFRRYKVVENILFHLDLKRK